MSKAAPLRTLHVLLLAVAVVLFGVALLLRQGGGLCAQKTGPLFFETSWLSGGAAVLHHASGDAAHHGGDGGAGAAQQLGQRGCPTSEEVAASPWASSCYHLTKVCVDNGGLILYDDRFQPAPHGGGEQAPSFAAEKNYGQYIYVYRNGHGSFNYPLASIRSRGQADNEGAEYLRQPTFSQCTVPVVWYPFWMKNFGHFLRDNSAKLWGFIEDTPWADGIKLVPVTAEGLALPGFNYQLLQAMTPLRVETWADFSSRLPQAGLPPEQPGPLPSAEGNHQRCFDSMLICTHGLNITRWPLHGFGRHLVQTYKHLLAPEARAAAETESAVRAGRPGSPTAGSLTMLSVVFQTRVGDTRQILNLEELLQRCNKWQHTTADGQRFGFKCWEAEITDLTSGMTAAQLADVMVGVHGANLANGWMLRPGSSMIEIQAYGFDKHAPHLQDPLFNAEDKESQVLWWVLQGCDPEGYVPSPAEAAGKGVAASWVKNRNVILRWEALQIALRQVADTGGDMQQYWQLWRSGHWWWHVNPHNITLGGHHHSVCAF
ncbi:hypothetical protein ABPG77_003054 [Micractinium sp. CCAP 211/92]